MKCIQLIIMLICLVCTGLFCFNMAAAQSPVTMPPSQKASGSVSEKSPMGTMGSMKSLKRTANKMGYEDTETNQLLKKYLDFAPQSPGNLLDLGCAWGYAVQEILGIEKQTPFLKPHNRKIIAIDMSQEHINHVAVTTSPELVETLVMRFPSLGSPQCKKAFSPNSLGATYAGLVFHYLSPDELTKGLNLLFDATAPGGRVYASVNTPYLSQSLLEDFLHRKKDLKEPFPGWYPNILDSAVPEKVRNDMSRASCGKETTFLHVFDNETMQRYFEDAGFSVVEHFYFMRNEVFRMKLLGIIAEKKTDTSLRKKP